MTQINLTLNPFTKPFELTNDCISWCKNAYEIHQKNIEIEELSIIAIAMVALWFHHILFSYSENIMKQTGLTEEQFMKLYHATSYFAFILLAVFLLYYVFWK